MFTHTTSHEGRYILVLFHKTGQEKPYTTMRIPYNGDWNEVDFAIDTMEKALTMIEEEKELARKRKMENLELLSDILHSYKDIHRCNDEEVIRVMKLEKEISKATNGLYNPDTTYDVRFL